jgi:hypothetical protein
MIAAALALTFAYSPPAGAADDRAGRDAQVRFEEGLGRVRAGDFEAARLSFAQAYAVLRKPDILWNLALSEEKSGHPLEALAHFKDLAKQTPADADRAKAQKHVDALMEQTGHIEVQAPAGTPLVLDGSQSAGTTPLPEPIDVAPGRHSVDGKLGDGTKSLSVDVAAGQVAHVSFMVIEPPAPAAPPVAQATSPEPGGSPAATPTPEPSRDATSAPKPPSRAPSTARLVTTLSLGGAAAVALGLGIYLGLASQNDASTAKGFLDMYGSSGCSNPAANRDCARWNSVVQAQNRDATLSNVFYVGGAVFAAGAVAAWFLWPKGARNDAGASVWFLPVVGSSGAGVGVVGRY